MYKFLNSESTAEQIKAREVAQAQADSVRAGPLQAEAFIGTFLPNATTNCYVWFPASSGLTSGAHYPNGAATYLSAN